LAFANVNEWTGEGINKLASTSHMNKSSKKHRIKNQKNSYLDLVGFDTPEQAYKLIKEWTSNLSDKDHFVRSVIFDIHAGIEMLFRQIFFHYFKPIIFETGEVDIDQKVADDLKIMVEKLSFGNMYQILWPILKNWPYDLSHIKPLSDLRNQVAHQGDIEQIRYKDRNPFRDADSFAQVFFDAWAVRQELKKFFSRRIIDPQEECKMYYEAYKKLHKID